ncbi:uncharacterized protein LOC117649101 [Thrips palmi]|uniref:Uncharacterized protein LOC117649101 n=1 Tax=Thrips palmi TaxID=161013 RepID=A0A6P8ZRD9_THRPL|nr:uncharacterized protein LOC117649101 [Thrips palmi]
MTNVASGRPTRFAANFTKLNQRISTLDNGRIFHGDANARRVRMLPLSTRWEKKPERWVAVVLRAFLLAHKKNYCPLIWKQEDANLLRLLRIGLNRMNREVWQTLREFREKLSKPELKKIKWTSTAANLAPQLLSGKPINDSFTNFEITYKCLHLWEH